MKQNSCIVVTGANGLAGSAVVEHLRKQFSCVVPLTRADADLRNYDDTVEFFSRVRPEFVFHAAATVYGLQGNRDNQAKSIFENTLINTHVINAALTVNVRKIVAMGTNAIYPWPAVLPYREETIFDGRPHDDEAAYGHAKRHMLAMLEAYRRSFGLNYTYLVSGNLYGPRDTFDPVNGHVLPALIHKFYEASLDDKSPVNIWGDGSARRDFLYSGDLADIVRLFMENQFNGAINIGSGKTHSISTISRHLCRISGVNYERRLFDATKPSGRPTCYADLSKLDTFCCGWRPQTTIYDGLKTTYDWYAASRAAIPA